MDEISIWRERVVQNFPQIDAKKVRKAFDKGLDVYRDPKKRYKFKNPYHTEYETYPDELSETDSLDSAFGSGWAAGVFERKQKCTRCGYVFTPASEKLPKTCPNPKCRSPYWNKPRTKGVVASACPQSNDPALQVRGHERRMPEVI